MTAIALEGTANGERRNTIGLITRRINLRVSGRQGLGAGMSTETDIQMELKFLAFITTHR